MLRFRRLSRYAVPALFVAATCAHADLQCSDRNADLGVVHAGKPLRRTFALANAGAAAVEIIELHGSCGCLTPQVDKRSLAPGERAIGAVEVSTLTQPPGRQSWRVRIRYRDGEATKETAVTLTATLVAEVSVEPATLVLHCSGGLSHEVTLIDRRARPLRIERAECTSRHVIVVPGATRDGDDGRRSQKIELRVLPEHPGGRHEHTLVLYTDDPDYRELRASFTVVQRLGGAVSASPASIEFPASMNGPPPSRLVRLHRGDERAIEIERVECDHTGVHCNWAAGPGTAVTLRVRLDPRVVESAALNAKVRVHLREPGVEPVVVTVRRPANLQRAP